MPATPSARHGNGKRLFLLDAMALAYRSHFIFISRPLINSRGQNTSAAYGFTTALLKLVEEHGMDHMAVVFDAQDDRGTFRSELYEDYKAHREKMPDELAENLPFIKDIVRAFDVPVLEVPGVEADDVIGTLALKAASEGAEVVIVSPDKDFQQLLGPGVTINRPAHRGNEFDPITADSFREKYGLEPIQFIDMLALMGDASDNVPGVPGIGEKTAMKLLAEYGSVETLLEHVDEVKGKRAKEGLTNHRDDALLSKELVTIKTDVEVDCDWTSFHRGEADEDALTALFADLEFGSLLERVQRHERIDTNRKRVSAGEPGLFDDDPALSFDFGPYEEVRRMDEEKVDYAAVRNRDELERLAAELAEHDVFAVDTETTSTDSMMASLVGLSVSWGPRQGRYVPTPMPDGTSTDDVLDVLRTALEGPALKVGHNLKYDVVVLARHGLRLGGPVFDTMIAHYLVAPEEQHALDSVARKYLSYRMVPITDLIGKGKNQRSMRDVPIDDVAPYACEDADVALRLNELLADELATYDLTAIAEDIEFPLLFVLADMELEGVRVDTGILEEISRELDAQLRDTEAQIFEAAGAEFNIGSTQQLGEILFNDPSDGGLGLRVVSKTSTGRPSTKESVLEELSTEHPLPGLILDWRRIAKLKSTYVDALGELVHPETGRVHTDFNQTITATGRLSSSNPNLQNIPVRTEQGREIRKAFVPREGWTLVAADYVQIELRILAAMSGDEGLRAAFQRGEDIHTDAAVRMFGVRPEDVTRDQRRKAKNVNYGIPYGVTAWGLAQRIRSTPGEAQELIDQYQKAYPKVMRFLALQVEQARDKGYVETLLGRRRYVPNINARNRTERLFAERVVTNMPVQGTQADMIKIAMNRIHKRLTEEDFRARMLLQVHDELVFEAPPEELDRLRALVDEEMTGALPLDGVPVEVDLNTGANWLDAH